MAIYREGYSIVNSIQSKSVQIFNDACDFGVPVKQDDTLWKELLQLVTWYKVEGSIKRNKLGCSAKIMLMDEWAVSDERKTVSEATEHYIVGYTKCTKGKCTGFDGYIYIEKVGSLN